MLRVHRAAPLTGSGKRPVDGREALALEERIGLGKMPAAEEAAVRRQRRRVRRLQHEVLGRVDERRLLLRVAAPQHEHDRLCLRVDLADDRVGEALPAAVAVRGRAAHLDGQHAVEQQHALARPMFEQAVAGPRDAEVDSPAPCRCWRGSAAGGRLGDREAQAVRLARTVVRVLAEDHDADLVERSQVERPEPVATLWENPLSLLLLSGEEALQLGHVRLARTARAGGSSQLA